MGTILSFLPDSNYHCAWTKDFSWNKGNSLTLNENFRRGLVENGRQATVQKTQQQRRTPGILRKESSTTPLQCTAASTSEPKPRFSRETAQLPPSRSRLPTPVKPQTNDSRKNVCLNDVTVSNDENESIDQFEAAPSCKVDTDVANCNATDRPYHPEPWPTSVSVGDFVGKLEREPTTVIFARFAPRNSKEYVEIRYSYNRESEEVGFETSGRLDTLVPMKEGSKMGESKAEQIEYFFRVFKTCINLLQGHIWWNGFALVVDQRSTKRRLKVSGFEADPSQILFELSNMKDLEVHRTSHKVELRGQMEGASEDVVKYFRIRGHNAKVLRVNKLRANLITVHVPDYQSNHLILSTC